MPPSDDHSSDGQKLLESYLRDFEGQPGFWRGTRLWSPVFVFSDDEHDRMRLMSPIGLVEELDADLLHVLLQITTDRALDALRHARKRAVVGRGAPARDARDRRPAEPVRWVVMLARTRASFASTELVFRRCRTTSCSRPTKTRTTMRTDGSELRGTGRTREDDEDEDDDEEDRRPRTMNPAVGNVPAVGIEVRVDRATVLPAPPGAPSAPRARGDRARTRRTWRPLRGAGRRAREGALHGGRARPAGTRRRERPRGDMASWAQVRDQVLPAMFTATRGLPDQPFEDLPRVLLGHSMGGVLALDYAIAHPRQLRRSC